MNKDSFNFSENAKYPYFTRTILNNGIAGYVNYLDEEHKIKGNSIAVGMLGMKFFYMENDFYAGQFTKTIFSKFENFSKEIALYFITEFNKREKLFKSVLVRDFEKEFNKIDITMYEKNNNIDYEFIKKFIKVIQKLVIKDVVLFAEENIKKTKKIIEQ